MILRRYTGPDGLPWLIKTDGAGRVYFDAPEALVLAFGPSESRDDAALFHDFDAAHPDPEPDE